jgi:hypothetical protein
MRFSKELMPSPSDYLLGTENVQKRNQHHRYTSPNYIGLCDKISEDFWLWLVEASLNECPAKSVNERLDKNDAARPPV